MTRHVQTLDPAYFDAVYASDPDPWKFASSDYERNKYAVTLAALPKPRYVRALEIGCSIGVLTRALAGRCDAILAVDVAQAPLRRARHRCSDLPNARFEQMFVPEHWPEGAFDLILLSEVVYYMHEADVTRLASRVDQSLAPGGDIVLVHWTEETDYPLTGDEAADLFIAAMRKSAQVQRTHRHFHFRLDVLARREATVAEPREGATRPRYLIGEVGGCEQPPGK
jgi:2-polyprenyl-3-methyl-5-hydroxy-6-metoxy-1,4-benzoquinol methylase